MMRLCATDSLFVFADSVDAPMNMGSVQILAPTPAQRRQLYERLRQFLIERIPYLPRNSQRLVVDPLGLPSWVDCEQPDPDFHIRRTRVRDSGAKTLFRKIGRLQHQPFDRSRPLFMFYLVEGLAEGRCALVQKYHHALADGRTAVRLLDLFSDEGSDRLPSPDALEAGPPASRSPLLRLAGGYADEVKRSLRSLPGLAGMASRLTDSATRRRVAALQERPRTVFNQPLSQRRAFAFRDWSLDDMNRTRRRLELTFNEIGLVLLGGALRRYLDEIDELPDASLVCNVPVALDTGGDDAGNAVLAMWVPIGTHIEDARERAGFVREQSAASKAWLQDMLAGAQWGPGIRLPALAMRLLGLQLGWPWLVERMPPPGNVALSNVPAPARPLHVAGVEITGLYGLPMILHGQGVSVTLSSYAGKVVTGLLCCERALPEPERVLDYMADELQALRPGRRGSRRPPQRTDGVKR